MDAATGWTETHWLPFGEIVFRLLLALALGAMVGFEREWRQRPAGLRTHILVCLASATAAIIAIEAVHMRAFSGETVRIDPMRLIESVTSGVAFLAAGFIVFSRGEVRGLTTGAGMWIAGVIGLSAGLGFWSLAVMATVFALIVLWLLRLMESHIVPGAGASSRPADEAAEGGHEDGSPE